MKNPALRLIATGLLAATLGLSAAAAGPEDKPEKKEAARTTPPSIRVDHAVKPADLPALAKISFTQALQTALARVPGGVIKAELEVEDGALMYSFEIVNAQHKVIEVEIDAGNGHVLDVDAG